MGLWPGEGWSLSLEVGGVFGLEMVGALMGGALVWKWVELQPAMPLSSSGAPKPSSNSIVVNILEESKQEAAKEPLIEEENSWDSPESGGSNVSLTNHQPPDVAPKPVRYRIAGKFDEH